MKTVTKLLPLKHPVGSGHNKFLRRVTLRDLTVEGKCNKSQYLGTVAFSFANGTASFCTGPLVHVFPMSNSAHTDGTTSIALNFATEGKGSVKGSMMTQDNFAIDGLGVGGKSRRTSRSPHFICLATKTVTTGQEPLTGNSELLRNQKRTSSSHPNKREFAPRTPWLEV